MVNGTPVIGPPATICAWVKPGVDMTIGVDYTAIQIQDSTAYSYYWLGVYNDYFSFWTEGGGGYEEAASSISPAVGDWYFVTAIARSSTDREILVDGGGSGTSNKAITHGDFDSIAIGRDMDLAPSDSWEGDIGPVGVWDTVLTLAEIRLMAQGYPMTLVRPQSLFYWPLRNGCDFEWQRRYDMTPYNTPTIGPHPPKVREYWSKIRQRATATQGISRLVSWGHPNEWNVRVKSPFIRVPRYGFINFQVPGVV